ncbi:MAG: AAA family ATPase [Fibrobacteres bacterium]|nr:AAA family ATPase [Fibrobacterota bacterium]
MADKNWVPLIGFTSTGKSTIGKLLASKLNLPFIDLDRLIEERLERETGKTRPCRQIYLEDGAEQFTKKEYEALLSIDSAKRLILATGGATPLKESAAKILTDYGTIVYLTAKPETIFRRMEKKGLPAYLRDDPTVENLKRHFDKRDPVYRSIADIILDTEAKTPDEIATALYETVIHLI